MKAQVYPNKIIQKGEEMYSLNIFLLFKRIKSRKQSKCSTIGNAYIVVGTMQSLNVIVRELTGNME